MPPIVWAKNSFLRVSLRHITNGEWHMVETVHFLPCGDSLGFRDPLLSSGARAIEFLWGWFCTWEARGLVIGVRVGAGETHPWDSGRADNRLTTEKLTTAHPIVTAYSVQEKRILWIIPDHLIGQRPGDWQLHTQCRGSASVGQMRLFIKLTTGRPTTAYLAHDKKTFHR